MALIKSKSDAYHFRGNLEKRGFTAFNEARTEASQKEKEIATKIAPVTAMRIEERNNTQNSATGAQEKPVPPALGDKYEYVDHPPHYQGRYEVIEILHDKMTKEEFVGFLKGNILKYIMRLGKKQDDLNDAKKALFYLAKLVSIYDKDNESKERNIIDRK